MVDDDVETTPLAEAAPPPTELTAQKQIEFSPTIKRLESRAIAARRRARGTSWILFGGTFLIALFLIQSLLLDKSEQYKQLDFFEGSSRNDKRATIEASLAYRVNYITAQLIGPIPDRYGNEKGKPFNPPSEEAAKAIKAELKDALNDLEKAVQIADTSKKPESSSSKIVPVVTTAVFSIGAMGLLVLVIQISVMFIRYHLRLAELYDAQADALRASGGNPALAYSLLQHFSPNAIELGKTPTSLYEKALDAIQAVAKK